MRKAIQRAAFLVAGLAVSTASAADPTKEACIDSDTQAQTLYREGKLRAAQSALRVCVNASCPGPVRSDCASRLDQVEREIPTVVFEMKDERGNEMTAVKVAMDGQPLSETLNGMAVAADPGEHTFTFLAEGRAPVTRRIVLQQGEKSAHRLIALGTSTSKGTPASSVSTVPGASPQADQADEARKGSGQRALGLIVGAAGIVGLGVGGAFGGIASSNWSHSKSACSTSSDCPSYSSAQSDRSSALEDATVSTVGFIAGGVLVATGIVLFLTAPKNTSSASATTALHLAPTVAPGSGGLVLLGGF